MWPSQHFLLKHRVHSHTTEAAFMYLYPYKIFLKMKVKFSVAVFICVFSEIVSRDIEVMNSGLMRMNADDMMLVFFVTLHHHGEKPRNVVAKMAKCCEKVTDDDDDCKIVELYGEDAGVMQPKTTANVTLLYPNLYGYNRKGSCLIDIWNWLEGGSEENDKIRHKVDFDTTLRLRAEEVPPFLRGFYNPGYVTRCETTDLDPFDNCNPVDCRLKYSGFRNYFSRRYKRCQKTPTCMDSSVKDLPDIAYCPISNTCKNLEQSVTDQDIQELMHDKAESWDKEDLDSRRVNIQCHHGEIDVRTGLCVCDNGYTSEPYDPEVHGIPTAVYHMCDKKCHPDVPPKISLFAIIMGTIIAIWVIFMITICEYCNFVHEQLKKNLGNGDEVAYYPVES